MKKIFWSLDIKHTHTHKSWCHITCITHRSSSAWRKETVRNYWRNIWLSHIKYQRFLFFCINVKTLYPVSLYIFIPEEAANLRVSASGVFRICLLKNKKEKKKTKNLGRKWKYFHITPYIHSFWRKFCLYPPFLDWTAEGYANARPFTALHTMVVFYRWGY